MKVIMSKQIVKSFANTAMNVASILPEEFRVGVEQRLALVEQLDKKLTQQEGIINKTRAVTLLAEGDDLVLDINDNMIEDLFNMYERIGTLYVPLITLAGATVRTVKQSVNDFNTRWNKLDIQ